MPSSGGEIPTAKYHDLLLRKPASPSGLDSQCLLDQAAETAVLMGRLPNSRIKQKK